jgi:hypothetical protein
VCSGTMTAFSADVTLGKIMLLFFGMIVDWYLENVCRLAVSHAVPTGSRQVRAVLKFVVVRTVYYSGSSPCSPRVIFLII